MSTKCATGEMNETRVTTNKINDIDKILVTLYWACNINKKLVTMTATRKVVLTEKD